MVPNHQPVPHFQTQPAMTCRMWNPGSALRDNGIISMPETVVKRTRMKENIIWDDPMGIFDKIYGGVWFGTGSTRLADVFPWRFWSIFSVFSDSSVMFRDESWEAWCRTGSWGAPSWRPESYDWMGPGDLFRGLPSGKLSLPWKRTINYNWINHPMAMFNSYAKLPESIHVYTFFQINIHVYMFN